MSSELESLVREALEIFSRVEVSDSGREFHPTTISSCRIMDAERIRAIFARLEELVGSE